MDSLLSFMGVTVVAVSFYVWQTGENILPRVPFVSFIIVDTVHRQMLR